MSSVIAKDENVIDTDSRCYHVRIVIEHTPALFSVWCQTGGIYLLTFCDYARTWRSLSVPLAVYALPVTLRSWYNLALVVLT